jgi:predicted ATPase
VDQFRRLLAAWREHGHPEAEVCPQCLVALTEAVELYRSGFLAGFSLRDSLAFDEWQLYQTEELRHELGAALERLVRGHIAQGTQELALPYARRWLTVDPLHEPAHRCLMQLYAQIGRRAAALRQYQECARVLEAELGLSPSRETASLAEQIRAQSAEGEGFPSPSPLPRHNLPAQLTPFIGREADLVRIEERLADPACRLLTLVGPGGIGKTRLALQLAVDVAAQVPSDRFPDGVYFVALAPIHTGDAIVPALAQAIGLSFHAAADPLRQLLGYLRDKQMLLVLDNVEQLIGSSRGEGDDRHRGEGTETMLAVLRAAPGVQLLVTSRVRMNASGEQVLAVPGMDYPTADPIGVGKPARSVLGYSGVQLYLQQARRVRSGYEPSEEALAQIGRVCRMAEGMPLAIVLAASWMDVLSPGEIADELGKSLGFLRSELRDLPERHRSMGAAFDASWGMLREGEREAFAALSVFRGGCTREAAEAVAGADLEILRSLVHKSFLTRDEDGRYHAHELLRQYGEEKLRGRPEAWERVRARHCAYYAEYLAGHKESFRKLGPGEARLEIDNVRAAWRWMLERDKVAECRQAMSGLFWLGDGWAWSNTQRVLLGEAVSLLRQAEPSRETRIALGMALCCLSVTLVGTEPERAPALAREGHRMLSELDAKYELAEAKMLAYLAGMAEDDAEADRLLRESLSLARETDRPIEEAWALSVAGLRDFRRAMLDGRPEGPAMRRVQEAHSRALEIYRRIGHRRGEAIALDLLALCARAEGQHAKARSLLKESLAIFRALDEQQWTFIDLRQLGDLSLTTGDYRQAQATYEAYWEESRARGNPLEARYALCGLGDVALATGEVDKAVGLFRRALQNAIEVEGFPGVERIMLSMAKLAARRGERARAAELLALAYHIVAPYSWERVGFAGGRELERALRGHLSPDAYAAAQERGQARNVSETLRELLAEVEGSLLLDEVARAQEGGRSIPGIIGQ